MATSNNDVLRKLRFAFDLSDDTVINIFTLGNRITDREEISDWLKKDEHSEFQEISDFDLASFLNGFIALKRGQKDEQKFVAEKELNNNLILRKLKIALNLKDTDMVEILKSMEFDMSKSEINAFFRKKDHPKFRWCKDQVLRIFLQGIIKRYHGAG